MNLDKWKNIKDLVESKFGFKRYDQEEFELSENDKGQMVLGEREIIEFEGPLGLIKLEFDIKPVILDKKVFGSKRIGGDNKSVYIYSEDEKNYKLRVYSFNNELNDWQEMDADNLLDF